MAGLINFGMTQPESAGAFAAGYNQAEQTRQTQQMNQAKLDQLKSDRDAMLQLQSQLKSMGKDTDLGKVADVMIATGHPDYVMKGLDLKSRWQAQQDYAHLFDEGGAKPPAAAPAAAAPIQSGALGSGTFGIAPEAPTNALAATTPPVANALLGAPTAKAPVSTNALAAPAAPISTAPAGPDQSLIAQTQSRINKLMAFAASNSAMNPQMANNAMAEARILQDQLELYSKRAPNRPAALQELDAYMNMSPAEKEAFEKLQKIKTPSTNVAVNAPVAKSLAGPVGTRAEASLAKAEGSVGMMENANMVRQALNSGNVIAGPLAGPRLKFAQLLDAAGAGDKEKLAATRNTIQGLAAMTLESRAELKGQGQVTENEQKLLERARSGSIEDMTVSELQQIVNVSQRLANRLWTGHQTLLKTMETDPAAADSLRYYRPVGTLAAPIGEGKPGAVSNQRRAGLDQIFGGKKP